MPSFGTITAKYAGVEDSFNHPHNRDGGHRRKFRNGEKINSEINADYNTFYM